MKQLQIHLLQDEAYCKNQSCSMQTMHTSIHILYSFIFPVPSTSLEWQIHVTQGSKDKLRGSQTTNIHQPVTNQPRKLKIGRLVHHFHTVCSLGWCCNLFQDPENRTIPTFVQHKGHGLKQGMSRGGRWSWIQQMKELAGLQRLQSAECRVPNCPQLSPPMGLYDHPVLL